MRKGVLDIGSNTVKFKIFEGDRLFLFHTYPVQIGTGLRENQLTQTMIDKIRFCFEGVKNELESNQAELSRVIGTSAIRDAENSSEIEKIIDHLFQKKMEIIPGSQEAELIYKGVRKGIKSSTPYLICDIGGGSVELIYSTNKEILKAFSFEVGVIKLYKLRKNADPFSTKDIDYYMQYLDQQMGEFLTDVQTKYLVGAAGSFESLYTLVRNNEYPGSFEELSMEELNGILEIILKSTQLERDENQLIPFERKILLPLGAILVKYLINKLEINKFTVSPNSLIEGLDL
ncbi:MAG: hypothetical protein KDC84_05320 [Crocinitomicaceae bacterium]|nr:hypothetical protein [Crocinitomicaceae bacterium]